MISSSKPWRWWRGVCSRNSLRLLSTDPSADFGEPLRWLVHGGPGTGKSHVIKLVKELFTDVLGWDIGIELQIVSLQAVMADLSGPRYHPPCLRYSRDAEGRWGRRRLAEAYGHCQEGSTVAVAHR